MNNFSTDRITILLVCPPGLEQKSLFTTINAVPMATVIARVPDMESALKIVSFRYPDVLVADANFLADEEAPLLGRFKQQHDERIRIVLVAASSQKRRSLQDNADYVLDYNNLNQKFPQIMHRVQADIDARFSD